MNKSKFNNWKSVDKGIRIIENKDVDRDKIIRINTTTGNIEYNPAVMDTFDNEFKFFLVNQVIGQFIYRKENLSGLTLWLKADEYALDLYLKEEGSKENLIRNMTRSLPVSNMSVRVSNIYAALERKDKMDRERKG